MMRFLKNMFGSSLVQKHAGRPAPRKTQIGVECLEKRDMMAGNILWNATLGMYTINGDNLLNDEATVSIVNNNTVHVVLGHRTSTGQFIQDATDNQSLALVNELRFFGNGGNDRFQNDTSIRSFAFGQAGSDTLLGGTGLDMLNGGSEADELRGRTGDDMLVGGSGNDSLFGGAGFDLLIGGLGADTLRGGVDGDILIGGTTNHDLNESSLRSIRSEWRSALAGVSYQDRISHLTGTATGGRNGATLLRFTNQASDTVHDDTSTDQLFGEAGQDWFFSRSPSEMPDRIIGASSAGGERVN